MATFGEALEALEEFRAELVNLQMNAPIPEAQAMAFRATAGEPADTPLANVHATGVGVRDDGQFVVKVYMFDAASMQSASSVSLLSKPMQGVHVDVEHLPVQTAFDRSASRKVATAAAGNPARELRRD